MKALVDNDILLKGACYVLLQEIVSAIGASAADCGVLGAARFVLRRKIEKAKLFQNTKLAMQSLETFLAAAPSLEPSTKEQVMAAQLEASALRLGLGLDAGESQLCAMVIERAVPMLITGDKRAIRAFEELVDGDGDLAALCGKLVCLEQMVLLLLTKVAFENLRSAICREPEVDKTLTICFSCLSISVSEPVVREGLDSYIRALRSEASCVLLP